MGQGVPDPSGPRGSHASNGAAERAILELAKQARTATSALEHHFPEYEVMPNHRIYGWLIRHSLVDLPVLGEGWRPYAIWATSWPRVPWWDHCMGRDSPLQSGNGGEREIGSAVSQTNIWLKQSRASEDAEPSGGGRKTSAGTGSCLTTSKEHLGNQEVGQQQFQAHQPLQVYQHQGHLRVATAVSTSRWVCNSSTGKLLIAQVAIHHHRQSPSAQQGVSGEIWKVGGQRIRKNPEQRAAPQFPSLKRVDPLKEQRVAPQLRAWVSPHLRVRVAPPQETREELPPWMPKAVVSPRAAGSREMERINHMAGPVQLRQRNPAPRNKEAKGDQQRLTWKHWSMTRSMLPWGSRAWDHRWTTNTARNTSSCPSCGHHANRIPRLGQLRWSSGWKDRRATSRRQSEKGTWKRAPEDGIPQCQDRHYVEASQRHGLEDCEKHMGYRWLEATSERSAWSSRSHGNQQWPQRRCLQRHASTGWPATESLFPWLQPNEKVKSLEKPTPGTIRCVPREVKWKDCSVIPPKDLQSEYLWYLNKGHERHKGSVKVLESRNHWNT